MKKEVKIEIGTEFYFELSKNMVICYDFYNNKYWCKCDTKFGFQFHWVTAQQVKRSIQAENKDHEVIFI